MKSIATALFALSVLTAVAAPIASANAETLGQQLERDGRFGHQR